MNTSRNAAHHLTKLQHCRTHMCVHTPSTHRHTDALGAHSLHLLKLYTAVTISYPGETCGCLQKWHAMCIDKLLFRPEWGRLANLASLSLLYTRKRPHLLDPTHFQWSPFCLNWQQAEENSRDQSHHHEQEKTNNVTGWKQHLNKRDTRSSMKPVKGTSGAAGAVFPTFSHAHKLVHTHARTHTHSLNHGSPTAIVIHTLLFNVSDPSGDWRITHSDLSDV